MERLGIYGGTFDPPHRGHLYLARAAVKQLDLRQVLWVLTPNPPHKTDQVISPLEDRLAMLELAIENQPGFEISMVDIDRSPPHFAVDTLRLLREDHPGDVLVYLLGEDSLRDLPYWSRPEELAAVVDEIGVLRRAGVRVDLEAVLAKLPGLAGKIRWIKAPMQNISSARLRTMIQEPEELRPFLTSEVWNYIRDRGLYR